MRSLNYILRKKLNHCLVASVKFEEEEILTFQNSKIKLSTLTPFEEILCFNSYFCRPQSVFFPLVKACPQFLTMTIFTLKTLKLRN